MLTEKDVDEIIASVTKEIDAAEMLAKSDKSKELKKDEPPKPEDEQDPAAAAAAEPPMDASSMPGEAQEPAAEGPAPDAAPSDASPEAAPEAPPEQAAQSPDQQLEGEPQGEISDEELMDIYQSMPPEELERHVMIAQQILAQMKGEQQAPEAPMPGEQPQPEQQQPMALSEKGGSNLAKSERDQEIDDLKKQVADLSKSTQLMTQALETAFKPVRKSVAGTEFVSRGSDAPEVKQLSKAELTAALNKKSRDGSTSKADREAINNYVLNGIGREAVEKMITGGK